MAFVAVIDDDEQVRTAIADLITSLGIESRGFCSSQEYLESATVAGTNCLITDVHMPGMSGLELHKTLRRQGFHMPVIFITGFSDERIRREAESLGALGFLRKPLQIGQLMACVKEALIGPRAAPP